ncbi:hypothetical protein [Microvirga pudoricolor]|uniref:hypothetical protein n=1 Tax=Microvirga pudoricolor TaxID=2778729 RepID=UPI00194E028A|nr:hypothetical protein [Microvirga pudoricolor]MBM6594155.1 hypothetical protein [Microvirga pudoricolor]
MTYTAKLAIFPPLKAPIPYEGIAEEFATMDAAWAAAYCTLKAVMDGEIAELAPRLREGIQLAQLTYIEPLTEVHGFLIYDRTGAEVGNWTSLDEALARYT